jgi:predicted O-methyltransferase YrrM
VGSSDVVASAEPVAGLEECLDVSARDDMRFAVSAVRRLPLPVARFVVRARRRARRGGDVFSIASALRPAKLAVLLEAARGRRTVVELGTGTAWTTIALALADGERTVVSYDVEHRPRAAYLALVDESVRARLRFVTAPGDSGPGEMTGVDLLFIDSSHEREPTLAEIAAWRPALAPDALVVFDDYGHPDYPGVAEAVAALEATGEQRASLFLWRPEHG